jgi:RNA polymerase sigma-70 factor (ECF subfamily)
MAPESDLVARARANDGQAIGELYDQYAERIYSYLYRRVGNAQIAEDLTGDTFLRVLEAIRADKSWRISFRAWLYRIAHNIVVDWYRRRGNRPVLALEERWLESETAPPSARASQAWTLGELREGLRLLTASQQQVLLLRFGEGLRSREVAEVLGKSVGAVEALQHRALETLREQIGRP